MSKVTKKQLQQSVDLLNKENSSQHDYLMRIKRALKSIDIDILSAEFDEPKPQLKQLDQSVFDGLDEKWRFAAVDGCTGRAYVYEQKPHFFHGKDYWRIHEGLQRIIGHDYDTSNWQNSLIERDIAKELTGSELCKAMIIGDRDWVLAYVSNENDATALFHKNAMVVTDFDLSEDAFYCRGENFAYAVPINNQGEPLTASEVGL
nr:hypothetical protein [uncultured Psychrobacter sp.]